MFNWIKGKLTRPPQGTSHKNWTGMVATGVDALHRRRDLHGETLRFPTGETLSQDNAGGLTARDRQGNIVKTVSRDGAETRYQYSDSNQLQKVTLHNGKSYERQESGGWALLSCDTRVTVDLDFRLTHEGALRVAFANGNGERFFHEYKPDGSALMANEKGRVLALRCDLRVQQDRLYNVLANLMRERLISCDQHQNLCDAFHSLLRRVALDELSTLEGAKTVYHVCRLLESSGRSPLGAQQVFMLANELLFFTACPDFADASDALSKFIALLFRHQPSRAAMVVADMSISKRFVTASDWTVSYVEELMHPHFRQATESTSRDTQRRFIESNRFLRVVLVNIVERLRMAKRTSKANVSLLDDRRRMYSTREFGRVFAKDLGALWQEVTGVADPGMDFSVNRNELVDLELDNTAERFLAAGMHLPRAFA